MPIRITWICDNEDALISLYKSESELDLKDLPEPLATNLINEYIDNEDKVASYYLVTSEYEGETFYSSQVSSESLLSGVFIFDLTQNYTPPQGNSVDFLGMS